MSQIPTAGRVSSNYLEMKPATDAIPFKFRRKSISEDLPSPDSSPLKSSSPVTSSPHIHSVNYRPRHRLSSPYSPPYGLTSPGFYSPGKTVEVPRYRLPSFKSMFGNISIDSHLTDDEDIPPCSDFDYNVSDYEFSDPDLFDDRRPSTSASSFAIDDPRDREHRFSFSSEHEEDAIIGLLDLRRRPRLSSFAESEYSLPSLVPAVSPEAELENPLSPTTPDYLLSTYGQPKEVKIEETDPMSGSPEHPCLISDNLHEDLLVKMEVCEPVDVLIVKIQEVENQKILPMPQEQLSPPIEASVVQSKLQSSPAILRLVTPANVEVRDTPTLVARRSESPLLLASSLSAAPSPQVQSPSLGSISLPKCEDQILLTSKDDVVTSNPCTETCLSLKHSSKLPSPSRHTSPLPSPSPLPSRLSPLPHLPVSPQPEEQKKPVLENDRSEPHRDSSPLSDISAQKINQSEHKPRKVSAKRRSLTGSDTRLVKKAKRNPEPGPSENLPQKNAKKEKVSATHKGERCRRSLSPLSTSSSHSCLSTSSVDREERHELAGMVIETLAMTRASSMDGEGVWRGVVDTRPNLKTKRTKAEWKNILYEVLNYGASKGFFGTVASSGKDEHNNPLPPRYFYIPDKDPDQERAMLLKSMMPRAGRRSESVKYKQYYWKPLGKWSRWDAEEEM